MISAQRVAPQPVPELRRIDRVRHAVRGARAAACTVRCSPS
jgi:hypothetical protein